MTQKNRSDVCCPEFDPKTLDGKTHVWKDKLFFPGEVKQLFHIPINMGPVITKMMKAIDDHHARPADKDFLMLCYDPSPWKSEIYMTVTRDIPDYKMAKISGTFVSRVFDGPYQMVPECIKQMDESLKSKNQKAIKYYFHYTYCPKCAKKFGHNYIVAFAKI